ncbi:MAG: molybdopterin oxidoreductase [Thermoprotei archaeon]|nr:MAG: molybdopterin oxidoreductase [Thermoprotei archaeon]
MAEQELICILCPLSCTLKVVVKPGGKITVTGNQCARGVEYAKQEILNPVRPVMSVVKVRNGDMPTVSVITSKPVPKKCIPEVMKATAEVEVEAPVELGQVILKNICGADIIATRRVKRVT